MYMYEDTVPQDALLITAFLRRIVNGCVASVLLGHAIGFDVWYNNRILCCGGAYVKTGFGG